jgi:hypothetical protein
MGAPGGATGALSIRATDAVAPCVRSAARAYPAGKGITIEVGRLADARADVLVGSAPEVTRALESGQAVVGSDVAVARIPWVIALAPGNPARVRAPGDLRRPDLEVWVLEGAAAYEARRHLEALAPGRVREAADRTVLGAAAAAVVPLSLAGPGERIPFDVPPIEAQAAVGAGSRRSAAARGFIAFLGSEAGGKAFAACAPASP